MGNYKFKPESILEFKFPLIGISTSAAQAVSYFQTYLTLAGISTDENGYLDLDQFISNYNLSSGLANTVASQYKEYYSNGNYALFNGALYDTLSDMPMVGYITLPFQVNGENIKAILPGTVPNFKTQIFQKETNASKIIIKRTKDQLTITNSSATSDNKTYANTAFDKNVVPFYLVFVLVGGGGGGSTQELLVAGRGGGGGACAAAVVGLVTDQNYQLNIGSYGAGGTHGSSDAADSSNHDGKIGGGTTLYSYQGTVLLSASGGYGGQASSSTCASGGSVTRSATGNVYPVYKQSTSTSYVEFTESDGAGGTGSVDTTTTGSSIASKILATSSNPSRFATANFGTSATRSPGASYNPGGGGGGATWRNNGAAGGKDTANGSAGNTGAGGGGGGFVLASYTSGGRGGYGAAYVYC